jgi:hypothetical protein
VRRFWSREWCGKIGADIDGVCADVDAGDIGDEDEDACEFGYGRPSIRSESASASSYRRFSVPAFLDVLADANAPDG